MHSIVNQLRYGKVSNLPFFDGILTRKKLNEIMNLEYVGRQPKNMDYRKEFIKGRGASTKDVTWNRKKHKHICCSSKVPWRHKSSCKKLLIEEGNEKWKELEREELVYLNSHGLS
jgi:hypothetical protein